MDVLERAGLCVHTTEMAMKSACKLADVTVVVRPWLTACCAMNAAVQTPGAIMIATVLFAGVVFHPLIDTTRSAPIAWRRCSGRQVLTVCGIRAVVGPVCRVSSTSTDNGKGRAMEQSRECTRCKGKGTLFHKGFTSLDGKVYPDEERKCVYCDGKGSFPAPDFADLVNRCFVGKPPRRRFRKSAPKHYGAGLAGHRAYYIWRLARFHGGADVCMPIVATTQVHGDPYVRELDLAVDKVAQAVYGTDKAAAYRWGSALGMLDEPAPAGLPSTAYPCGPAVTVRKPVEEYPELS